MARTKIEGRDNRVSLNLSLPPAAKQALATIAHQQKLSISELVTQLVPSAAQMVLLNFCIKNDLFPNIKALGQIQERLLAWGGEESPTLQKIAEMCIRDQGKLAEMARPLARDHSNLILQALSERKDA